MFHLVLNKIEFRKMLKMRLIHVLLYGLFYMLNTANKKTNADNECCFNDSKYSNQNSQILKLNNFNRFN